MKSEDYAVTVLVITCPHALGLAIPLVIANSTVLAAKNGILVRNRDALERAKDIKKQQLYLPNSLQKGLNVTDERGESAVVMLDESQAVAVISMAGKVRKRARETMLMSLSTIIVAINAVLLRRAKLA